MGISGTGLVDPGKYVRISPMSFSEGVRESYSDWTPLAIGYSYRHPVNRKEKKRVQNRDTEE